MHHLNVLLASPFVRPEAGGPSVLLEGLKAGLVSAGCGVSVVSNVNRLQLSEWINVAELGSAVAHNFGLWAPLNHSVSKASSKCGIPIVCAPMGMLDPWALNEKKLKKKVAWFAYQGLDTRRADCFHATAELELAHIRAAGLKQPVAIIPCGVAVPSLTVVEGRAAVDGPKRLLFLSRIHPKKGILAWVEASRSVAGHNWSATIAGPCENSYRTDLEAAIAAAGLAQHFVFSEPVYDLQAKADLFNSSDVFVLPSHSENFGIVIAEALAHALPVITTTATPWESLVREGAGWWVPPTPDALAVALQDALSLERTALRAMGLRGRALIEREFAWPVIIRHHTDLYAWMLGHGPRPDFVME